MAESPLLNELPREVLTTEILARCSEYMPAVRAVCRLWRESAKAFGNRVSKGKGLSFLAKDGHTNLVVWTKEIRGRFMLPQLNNMLASACRRGHSALVYQLHDWGANYTFGAIVKACRGGHAGLAFRLRQWAGGVLDDYTVLSSLRKAAYGGHYGLVATMWDWFRAPDLPGDAQAILCAAAHGGHADIMRLAITWGAAGWGTAFRHAAHGGHLALMEELRPWATAAGMTAGMSRACSKGHIDAVKLLLEWGISPTIDSVYSAAENGNRELVELLLKALDELRPDASGVTCDLLGGAALSGHADLCLLARERGAVIYEETIRIAAARGHANVIPLIYKWYLEDTRTGGELSEHENAELLADFLDEAASNCQVEAAVVLRGLGAKFSPNESVGQPFSEAAVRGNTEFMRLVRRWNAEDGMYTDYSAAMVAAAENGEEHAMGLIQECADEEDDEFIDHWSALRAAAHEDQVYAMILLKQLAEEREAPFATDSLTELLHEISWHHKAAARLLEEWGAQRSGVNGPVSPAAGALKEQNAQLVKEALEELLGESPL
jgi:hypothetical protein